MYWTVAAAAAAPCEERAATLCDADPHCAAFGIFGDKIQLHGCLHLVPNHNWTIFNRTGSSYARVAGSVNVDEGLCEKHPASMDHSCSPPPPPPAPSPPLGYAVSGSVAVGTLENSLFLFRSRMYILENIGCGFIDHAGQWDPRFANASYARIRELDSGRVVVNISETIGFAFISSYPDAAHGRVWLFGVDQNRCHGTRKGDRVQAWWSGDLVAWDTAPAVQPFSTYNVEVARVDATVSPAMPVHTHVMILEPFSFLLIDAPDGNLTRGWFSANSTPPHTSSGGPSIRFADGYYYVLTGGHNVDVFRSRDLRQWQPGSRPLIAPTAADATVSPLGGFPANAARMGFGPMEGHPEAWDWNSNDGDVCCSGSANGSWLVWGASTQGRKPTPPVTHGCANVVGHSALPLAELLAAYF